MFRYRLHSPNGNGLGEATYAQMIHPGEEIIAGSSGTAQGKKEALEARGDRGRHDADRSRTDGG